MTTPDPASPVAAALAVAESAEQRAANALNVDGRDYTFVVLLHGVVRDDVPALVAHIRTLAARDAEQTARMAGIHALLPKLVAWADEDGNHLTAEECDCGYCEMERAIRQIAALLADAGDAQRETGDDE